MSPAPIARPFAGLRYARADLSGVLAPPYDVIGADERARLLARDPHNAVRLELSYVRGEEAGDDDRYSRAGRTLQEWREQGILRCDEGASLYPCAHDFTLGGCGRAAVRPYTRVGVLCAVRLSPFAEGLVLPHEGTLRGACEDRRRLMLACRAQTSPVLALHDDPDGRARDIIAQMMQAESIAQAHTNDERHRLWRWPADDLALRYCEAVGPGPLFIADGHHRYETALEVARASRRDDPAAAPEAAFNYVLMLLCPTPQPGVVILPAHRLLKLKSQEERTLLETLISRHFTIKRTGRGAPPCAPRHSPGRVRFGVFTRGGGYALLTTKAASLPSEPGPGGYDELPTVLLHRLLIEPVVGAAERVHYVTDEAEAVAQVREGRFECALLVPPTTVAQVQRVALAGLRMPGKSTYFYPKAPAGLVISDISHGRVIP